MSPELERRLAEFVDRRAEMARFCEMLDGNEKRIMVVWGDSGLGKSSLLARMIHEAALRKIPKAEVVWTNTRKHDYLATMRKVRDDLGVDSFQPFTDLVNFFTVPQYSLKICVEGSISVATGASISGSTVGDIAGVLIKDSMIVVPRQDMAVPEYERMIQLTNRFIENLSALFPDQRGVIFFDAIEKMSEETRAWLWGELLQAVLDDRLPNIRCVLCGQNPPELHRDMASIVESAQLSPLEVPDIIEYLARRGVDKASCEGIAHFLRATAGGKPLQIAVAVDAALKSWATTRAS